MLGVILAFGSTLKDRPAVAARVPHCWVRKAVGKSGCILYI
jgi:hypothetical protein